MIPRRFPSAESPGVGSAAKAVKPADPMCVHWALAGGCCAPLRPPAPRTGARTAQRRAAAVSAHLAQAAEALRLPNAGERGPRGRERRPRAVARVPRPHRGPRRLRRPRRPPSGPAVGGAGSLPAGISRAVGGLGATPGTEGESATSTPLRGSFSTRKGGSLPAPTLTPTPTVRRAQSRPSERGPCSRVRA